MEKITHESREAAVRSALQYIKNKYDNRELGILCMNQNTFDDFVKYDEGKFLLNEDVLIQIDKNMEDGDVMGKKIDTSIIH